MNKILYTISIAIVIVVIGSSAINSPQQETHSAGYFSSTAQSCSCHGTTMITSNNILITGIPDTVVAGQSYPMSLTISNPSGKRFGFAINSGTTGGTFTTTNPYAQVSKGYEMTHLNPPAATGTYTWGNITWTAPAKAGTAKIAYCGLCGKATSGSSMVAGYKNILSTVIVTVTPVKLSSFDIAESKGKVNMAWTTASEINVAYFSVQRSLDGANFTTVGKVTASGNSASLHSYDYTDDATNLSGAIYYRLNTVDKDGKNSFSKVVSVSLTAHNSQLNSIYPNPLRAGQDLKLNYASIKTGSVSVQLVSMLGKRVLNTNLPVNEGSNTLSVAVGHLTAGVYYLSVVSENGSAQRQQLVIQ